ncbi:MAG: UDP-N-acetylmuramoyl-tripeptide--D-alanyl-D-alanine ligase [Eubacteriales bacterium]|jgi:UDP-N-acetylmuramoyl-tripeptide--D-alanyl-D-alanine ligase
MIKVSLLEIANAVRGELTGNGELTITNVVTDSRQVVEGSLFIAIQGEKVDGHNFIPNAYEQGAVCVICDRYPRLVPKGKACVVVRDTKKAILELASYYRDQFHIPIVGVTGSVGKTTTKEFVYSVLSMGYNTCKTEGNYNNEIGLPLTVFRLERDTQALVLEMGMSGFGEIEALTNVAKPYIGIITNIGTAHLENLGSREGILKAKLEIVKGIAPNGYLLLNKDEPLLNGVRLKRDINVLYYGINDKTADVYAEDIEEFDDYTTFSIKGKIEKDVRINTVGLHNVYNALAAACVGYLLGIGPNKMAEGLLRFHNVGMRQNIYEKNGVTVIDDCYNANPDSVKAALQVLEARKGRHIAVLGDMLELGNFAELGHREVGVFARQHGTDILLCCGDQTQWTVDSYMKNREPEQEAAFFSCKAHLGRFLKNTLRPGDVVLFKGSRGMAMEEIIPMAFGEAPVR